MSSTGIPALYISLAVVSLVFITFGPLIDELNGVNIDVVNDPTIPISYERADTWKFIILVYHFWPLWVFLGGIIGTIVIAMSPSGGVTG